ncbi:MAG: formylglycine-generating enzyme family protein, partial [Planctomycetia bacterium]|nr:formylglycine-generating enzyme family protein [Planctomycetia bacterium]
LSRTIPPMMFRRTWILSIVIGLLFASSLAAKEPATPTSSRMLFRSIVEQGWVVPGRLRASADTAYSLAGVKQVDDCLFLASGDRVSGHLVGIAPNGVVRLANPLFAKPFEVRIDSVQSIVPTREGKVTDGPDWVVLTSGESIHGLLGEINATHVVMQTRSMGALRIQRSVVAIIELRAPQEVLFETDFSDGTAGPWQQRGGEWEVRDGKFHCLRRHSWVSAGVDQRGPVTVEWTAVRQNRGHDSSGLSFFVADADAGHWGLESIYFRTFGDDIQVYEVRNNGPRPVMFKRFRRFPTRATFRAAYDPESGRLRLWVNNIDMGEYRFDPPIRQGKYIHLYSGSPCIYESVRLLRGAPGIVDPIEPARDEDRFVMANRDKVSGTFVGYADDLVAMRTPYGTLKIKKSDVYRIILRRRGRKALRRRDDDSDIVLHGGPSFRGKIIAMDENALQVSSASLGELKISRGALKQIICPPPNITVDLGGSVMMRLAAVPPGQFTMGPPTPPVAAKGRMHVFRRHVTITKPFLLGLAEVTRAQFAAFVRATRYKTDAERFGFSYVFENNGFVEVKGASWKNPGFRQDDDHPVVCVSWNDAQAFCKWLSKKTGRRARLPTEAEWEYACRADTATPYSFGKTVTADQVNFNALQKKGDVTTGIFRNTTTRSRSFGPNHWGFYDMHGNAAEWSADRHTPHFDKPVVTDPAGPKEAPHRVMRGGAWYYEAEGVRSDSRSYGLPNYRNWGLGFRVAMDPKQ